MDKDDAIRRYKAVGLSDEVVALRLGIPVEEVRKRWRDLQKNATLSTPGYSDLVALFSTLSTQYMALGKSLQVLGLALGELMPASEIRALISDNPEETLNNFVQKAIVLRPFQWEKYEKLFLLDEN